MTEGFVTAPSASHVVIACGIALGHGLLWAFSQNAFYETPAASVESEDEPVSVSWIRARPPEWDTAPMPDIRLAELPPHLDSLQAISFDADDDEEDGHVIGASSAPQLTRFQTVSLEDFSARARVAPNHPVTVVVSLDVLRDGTVGTVSVVRSCGDRSRDAVAADYARRLRWIAGTVNRVPEVMRVLFPVTLAVSLQLDRR